MNKPRKLPSELVEVASTEAGEVLQAVPEPSPVEARLAKLESRAWRGAQLLDMEPQKWKVPGWLPCNAVVAVYAAPGVGKSFYAFTLALEIARGGEWLGTRLEPENVLYLAAEKATTLRDRAEAWCTYHEELIPDRSLLIEDTPQLSNPIDVEALCTLIEKEHVTFVVIDTYAMTLRGIDENSSKESGIPIAALSRLREATKGGTVLVVHHTGKDSSKGLRGSTALLAAVDLSIEVVSTGAGRLQAAVRKSNAGAEPMPEHYLLETVPLSSGGSSAVLKATGAPAPNPELEALLLGVLESSPGESMTANELREALNEQTPKALSRSTFDRQALTPLLNKGKVQKVGSARSTRYQLAK